MKKNLQTQIGDAKNLLDVLLILKEKTMLDTHVATLAYLKDNVQKFNGKYGLWSCNPFPLDTNQNEYSIQAYYFHEGGDSFPQEGLVLIVFTDRNFINSLKSATNIPKETQDLTLHSIKFGIIVSLPNLDLTLEEKEEILDFDSEDN